jgi:prepilin-type N-terminal cleavage/methylation domain-containing protein
MAYIRKQSFISRCHKFCLSLRAIRSWIPNLSCSRGFTLVEIMVATAISMLIIGSVYAAFKTSLKIYQQDETKIVMLQKCRSSLDRIARDISNMFYADSDEELTFMAEDNVNSETEKDEDMISFVTIINPNLKKYVSTLTDENTTKTVTDTTTGEETTENTLPSDLARVIYYIGQNPEIPEIQSLMRVETSDIDTQTLKDLMSELQSSSSLSSSSSSSSSSSTLSGEDLQDLLKSSILVDNIAGLNIRYFDGTDWLDAWDIDEEKTIPSAVEITLSVTDPENKGKAITQAIVVSLPFGGSTDETASTDQTSSGNQTQTP